MLSLYLDGARFESARHLDISKGQTLKALKMYSCGDESAVELYSRSVLQR